MPQSNVPTFEATADGEAMVPFRSEIDAMPAASVLVPRVDVVAAALTAIGAMPEIEAHRASILAVFGESEGATLDRLAPIANALMEAHAVFLTVAERDLEPMAEEVMAMRTRLFLAASALIQRKLLDKKALDTLTGGQSYQARISDTMALVEKLKRLPAEVRTRQKVDAAVLAEAKALAQTFGVAFAEREKARAGASKEGRDRARVFTLFFQTYERVRQMLTYLRWDEDDVEKIAPSLFTRGPRKQDADDVTRPTPSTGNPPSSNPVRPGLPGADPFTAT